MLAWQITLAGSGALLTVSLSCIVPFAAIAFLAARTMSRRAAAIVIGLAVMANQIVGFAYLHYPRTADAYVWIPFFAIGAYASLAVALRVRSPIFGFALAFGTFEFVIFVASVATGSAATFELPIELRVAGANLLGFGALGAAYVAIAAIDQLAHRPIVRAER